MCSLERAENLTSEIKQGTSWKPFMDISQEIYWNEENIIINV